jgi:hypothetical protein
MSAPHLEFAEDDEEDMSQKVGIITGGASGLISPYLCGTATNAPQALV